MACNQAAPDSVGGSRFVRRATAHSAGSVRHAVRDSIEQGHHSVTRGHCSGCHRRHLTWVVRRGVVGCGRGGVVRGRGSCRCRGGAGGSGRRGGVRVSSGLRGAGGGGLRRAGRRWRWWSGRPGRRGTRWCPSDQADGRSQNGAGQVSPSRAIIASRCESVKYRRWVPASTTLPSASRVTKVALLSQPSRWAVEAAMGPAQDRVPPGEVCPASPAWSMVTMRRARDLLVRRAVGSAVGSSVSGSGAALSSQYRQMRCNPSRRRRAAVRVSPVTRGDAASIAALMAAPVVSSHAPER